MNFIFTFLKNRRFSGIANRNNIWIHLEEVFSYDDLYAVLEHEELHKQLFKIGIKSQFHHKLMQNIGFLK